MKHYEIGDCNQWPQCIVCNKINSPFMFLLSLQSASENEFPTTGPLFQMLGPVHSPSLRPTLLTTMFIFLNRKKKQNTKFGFQRSELEINLRHSEVGQITELILGSTGSTCNFQFKWQAEPTFLYTLL